MNYSQISPMLIVTQNYTEFKYQNPCEEKALFFFFYIHNKSLSAVNSNGDQYFQCIKFQVPLVIDFRIIYILVNESIEHIHICISDL